MDPFIAITPRSILTRCSCISYGPKSNRSAYKLFILSRNTWYYIIMCKKNLLRNNYTKNINIHLQFTHFPNPGWFDIPLTSITQKIKINAWHPRETINIRAYHNYFLLRILAHLKNNNSIFACILWHRQIVLSFIYLSIHSLTYLYAIII